MAKLENSKTQNPKTPNAESDSFAVLYIGRGDFLSGVPTRDLTVAEFEELTPGQRELCVTSGLYTVTVAGRVLLPDSPVLAGVEIGKRFVLPDIAQQESVRQREAVATVIEVAAKNRD